MTNPTDFQLINFTGKINLIVTNEQLVSFHDELNSAKTLGFDTETRPAFAKGEFYNVALVQLANETDAYLIRLHGISDFNTLKTVFENPAIVKVGAAIRDDLKNLKKLFSFTPEGFVELQDVAKAKGLKNFGLKGMTEELLQARLSKRAKTSNWEAAQLNEQQIMYAATDAWVGLELYKKLNT